MNTDRLRELYGKTSKHSNYQVLPGRLKALLGDENLETNSRWERERLSCMCSHCEFGQKMVGDIGGNTGFFTFELIEQGASEVNYFEGNEHHANFVREAAAQLNLADQIKVSHGYFSFDEESLKAIPKMDVLLLLNVLHHVGDDYGDQKMSIERALEDIAHSLCNVAAVANTLIFQLGFNWKGDRHLPLFENGTKSELIEFVRKASDGIWAVDQIAIPVREGEEVVYKKQDSENVRRDDALGEFLNRPLFFLSRV